MERQKVIAGRHACKLDSMVTEAASTTTDMDSDRVREWRITCVTELNCREIEKGAGIESNSWRLFQ
jgi:hypothetical protein